MPESEVPPPLAPQFQSSPSCHFREHMVSIIQMGRAGSSIAIPMLAKQMEPGKEEGDSDLSLGGFHTPTQHCLTWFCAGSQNNPHEYPKL